jgi:arylsulfatase A-like enzyme
LNNEHSLEEIELDATARMPAGDRIPLRYRLMRQWQEAEAVLDRARLRKLLFFGITQEEYREMKQRYFGLITMVDQSIGAILSCLERFDLSDHTIVMHTSDHGDSLGAHHLFGKEVMFEEAVRVPYLVRMPGQRRNSRIAQPISHIDFLPTVMELLGRPVPVQCAGISRVSLLRGEAMTPESVFIEWSPNRTKVVKGTSLAPRRAVKRACDESTRAIVTADGWKICFRDKDMNELYNFKNDPIEAENLWDNRSQASVVDRAREELHQWQETVGDRLSL